MMRIGQIANLINEVKQGLSDKQEEFTPYQLAQICNNLEEIRRNQSQMQYQSKSIGLSSLQVAIMLTQQQFFDSLVCCMQQCDQVGRSALMYACYCHENKFLYFLQSRELVAQQVALLDSQQQSALDYALEVNNIVALQFLQSYSSKYNTNTLLKSNFLNFFVLHKTFAKSDIQTKICENVRINYSLLLHYLFSDQLGYQKELDSYLQKLSVNQLKQYNIRKLEIAEIKLTNDKNSYQYFMTYQLSLIFKTLEAGCLHLNVAGTGVQLFQLFKLGITKCNGDCQSCITSQYIEYIDEMRSKISNAIANHQEFKQTTEKNDILCPYCHNKEFNLCFMQLYQLFKIQSKQLDDQGDSVLAKLFNNCSLIDSLSSDNVITILKDNLDLIRKQNFKEQYVGLTFLHNYKQYNNVADKIFLLIIQEGEINNKMAQYFISNVQQLYPLIKIFLQVSQYLKKEIKSSSSFYSSCYLLLKQEQIDCQLFDQVCQLYFDNCEQFLQIEISPFYSLEFDKPYSLKLIRYYQQLNSLPNYVQKFMIQNAEILSKHYSDKLINPISRILLVKDQSTQQAFLNFYEDYIEDLQGKCYDKNGKKISPYALQLHDRAKQLFPENIRIDVNGYKANGMQPIEEDSLLLQLVKKKPFKEFCQRSLEMLKDYGKYNITENNSTLIQYSINFGNCDCKQCKALQQLVEREHGCCDKDNHTAAFYAVRRNNYQFVQALALFDDEFYFNDYSNKNIKVRTPLHEAAINLNFEMCQFLISKFPKLLNLQSLGDNNYNATLFMIVSYERQYQKLNSAEEQMLKLFDLLVSKEKICFYQNQLDVLQYVVSSTVFGKQSKESLVEIIGKYDKDERFYENDYNQLMVCAKHDIVAGYNGFKQFSGKVSYKKEFALLIALQSKANECFYKLLPFEHKVKYKGQSILHLAVQSRRSDIALYMVQKGYCVKEQDNQGNTALMMAIEQKLDGLIQVLSPLEQKLCNNEGQYAIHFAINHNNKVAFSKLFAAEGSLLDIHGNSLLQYTFNNDLEEATSFTLKQLCSRIESPQQYLLFLRSNYSHNKESLHQQLILRDNRELFSFLLSLDAKFLGTEFYASRIIFDILALHISDDAKIKYIDLLLTKYQFKQYPTPTPLMFVACNKVILSGKLFNYLYQFEPREQKMLTGKSLLSMLVLAQNTSIVKLLLKKKQSFSQMDKESIIFAAQTRNYQLLAELIDFQTTRNDKDETALMKCAEQGYLDGMQLLVPREIGITNKSNQTALVLAILNRQYSCTQLLAQYENERVQINNGTILQYTISNSLPEYAKLFLNFKDQKVEQSLQYCLEHQNAEHAKILLASNILTKEQLSKTFFLAAQNDLEEICILLQQYNEYVDGNGFTGLFFAILHDNSRIALLCKNSNSITIQPEKVQLYLGIAQILVADTMKEAVAMKQEIDNSGTESTILVRSGPLTASQLAAACNKWRCLSVLCAESHSGGNAFCELDYALLNTCKECILIAQNQHSNFTEKLIKQLDLQDLFENVTSM